MKNLIVGIIISMLSLTATQVLAETLYVNNHCGTGKMLQLIPDILRTDCGGDITTSVAYGDAQPVKNLAGSGCTYTVAPLTNLLHACLFVGSGSLIELYQTAEHTCSCRVLKR